MAKRSFWLVTGVAVGAGSSLWVERRVRRGLEQAAARLQPESLASEVAQSARRAAGAASGRVRGAVSSGRDEMRRREEELWEALAGRGAVGMPGAPGTSGAPGAPGGPVIPGDRSGPAGTLGSGDRTGPVDLPGADDPPRRRPGKGHRAARRIRSATESALHQGK